MQKVVSVVKEIGVLMGCGVGAGVLPFCVQNNQALFLFHQTREGKKKGTLIDFGGGVKENESMELAAAREFSEEETAGLFGGKSAQTDERVKEATEEMYTRLTGNQHEVWQTKHANYQLYITQVPFVPAEHLDMHFSDDAKQRQFKWVPVEDLIAKRTELPLFVRVREAENLLPILASIQEYTNKQ